jgi:hypothetical protein
MEQVVEESIGRTSSLEWVVQDVAKEVLSAEQMYPWWPRNPVHQAAIASEESGEVVKEVNNFYWRHGESSRASIYGEAIQAAAMWVRFAMYLEAQPMKTELPDTEPVKNTKETE